MRNLSFIFLLLFFACTKEVTKETNTTLYFPPNNSTEWQTTTPQSLNWNEAALNDLYTYLQSKSTNGFIILKNGKIVVEKYFGSFTGTSNWYWASAGKTLTAMIIGIAQQEGKLQLSHKTSQYLGTGWTSLPAGKESLITIKHQLTMTSGMDDTPPDNDCTLPSCLKYVADAGTRWAYHNAPYTLLEKVVEAATGTTYNNYFDQKIKSKIDMNGVWYKTGDNNVFYSNTRSAARFGLLMLNKGTWNGTKVLDDAAYFNSMINSSQSLNPSYGFLTWLNGKSSHMLPSQQASFNGMLVSNAPADMYAALGKNDQKIYVVPSQNIVVVRFGEDAGNNMLASSSFDNELWGKLKEVIRY